MPSKLRMVSLNIQRRSQRRMRAERGFGVMGAGALASILAATVVGSIVVDMVSIACRDGAWSFSGISVDCCKGELMMESPFPSGVYTEFEASDVYEQSNRWERTR